MLAIQFSTITNGYRATLVFSNTGALGNGYDNYDMNAQVFYSENGHFYPAGTSPGPTE